MALTTVLTGVKPTGMAHIGNYLGAIRPAIELSHQPQHQTWLFIADYHSLTSIHDAKVLHETIYDLAATWLACGLDPKKAVLYRQSDIPEIFELTWILSCFTPKGLMNRAHAYKAMVQDNQTVGREDVDYGINMGLFNYPILMAADILMFSAAKVPVGEDQVQHLEIARDVAQKFNRQYGELLRVPVAVLQKDTKLITGIDGRKMSKSYDNHIPMFLESKSLRKIIMRIKTDSLPPEAPKNPQDSILFELYSHFANGEQIEDLRTRYQQGIAYGHVKEELFQLIDQHFKPAREKYQHYMSHRDELDQILGQGAEVARAQAAKLLKEVRSAIGIAKPTK